MTSLIFCLKKSFWNLKFQLFQTKKERRSGGLTMSAERSRQKTDGSETSSSILPAASRMISL